MVEFLYRRIANNKWLFACLLIGAVTACAIFACIPMYSNAILQKVLVRDFTEYHNEHKMSPGIYKVECNVLESTQDKLAKLNKLEDIVKNQLLTGFSLPVVTSVKKIGCIGQHIKGGTNDEERKALANLVSMSELEKQINIVHGRLAENSKQGETYEVVVTEKAMKVLDLLLDHEYELYDVNVTDKKQETILKVKIVGVFRMKDAADLYWSTGRYSQLDSAMLADEKLMSEILGSSKKMKMNKLEWVYYFDYNKLKIQEVAGIMETFSQQKRWVEKNNNIAVISSPLQEVLKNYGAREKQLKTTLWILTIPLFIILCFYSLLITRLIIKNDQNEIAVLKSRGAGTFQIFTIYIMQSAVVAGIAFIAGPFIGFFICQVLGASNGFLEFVGRKVLQLELSFEIFAYSLAGALVFSIFMLIPALNASRISIVEYKRSIINSWSKPIWHKFYLDVLLLGVSLFGLYMMRNHKEVLEKSGLSGTELSINPLLYFTSTFFILGASLIFLRFYPVFIRLLFKVGEKWWGPVVYFSLTNVSRAEKNLQFIMLFLMLTLAFGITNANQARTLNRNIEDRIMYKNGADVVIEPYNNLKHVNDFKMRGVPSMAEAPVKQNAVYIAPTYEGYEKINGVEAITKVYTSKKSYVSYGSENIPNVSVMGVTPHEFGKVAWFRNGLLSHHINEYLNCLGKAPKAVILSSNIKKEHDIKVGDEVQIKIGQSDYLSFVVYAFIDYFPTFNPYNEDNAKAENYFAVLNYTYLQKKLPAQPYEVWIKKKPGISDSTINNEIETRRLFVERVDYASQKLVKMKNDPMIQGTNGILTMCFIITMLVTAIGFMVFWILSLKERALKFGVSRAMGMSMKGVTMIMVFEQLLISGCAIVAGVLLGSIGSEIFIPVLQIVNSAANQVPPFRVIALPGDYAKVLLITLVMLVIALVALYVHIKHIKINQVLKLGED